MSFDMAFWFQLEPPSAESAAQIYDRLTDGETGVVSETTGVEHFFNDVVAVFPDLNEQNAQESPWSSPIYRTPECVITAISWSRSEEVAPILVELAQRHGLTTYDPQDRVAYHPLLPGSRGDQ
jgi:hypothetical protein